MKIYIVKHETSVGPFFSSLDELVKFLMEDDNRSTARKLSREEHVSSIIRGNDPYCSVVMATLDDWDVCFDS